jgi:hypothetical protein
VDARGREEADGVGRFTGEAVTEWCSHRRSHGHGQSRPLCLGLVRRSPGSIQRKGEGERAGPARLGRSNERRARGKGERGTHVCAVADRPSPSG